jgi:hypothetical protein
MTDPAPRPPKALRLLGPFALLAAVLAAFATTSDLGFAPALLVALVGAGAGAGARAAAPRWARAVAPAPPLVALGLLATTAVPDLLTGLFGVLVAVVYLLWLAEDPDRVPGGIGRAVPRVLVPLAGGALAWASALLLPPGSATAGVAAALLGLLVAAVALLVRRPRALDGDPAATS